jgi:ribosomal protein S18 acetylase RimI-like enzyme
MTAHDAIAIIEFRPEFTDELVPMWRESFEDGVGIVDPNPIEEQKQFFVDEILPNDDVQVALQGDRIVGFVAASRESVSCLYVRVGMQRQGLGTRMLDWAKDQSNGSLWLYTFAQNARACAFYQRSGFLDVAHGFEEQWQLADVRFEWTRA